MKEKTISILGKKINRDSWAQNIISYVLARQNTDGGYAFVQGLESNAQDTYYGLAILRLLEARFPNLEQTMGWLHEFVRDSLYSHYYVAKALNLCGEGPDKNLKDFLRCICGCKREFGTIDVYVEVASEFVTTLMVTELVNITRVRINREKIRGWLLGYQNKDGGFGAHACSSLNSTYHAVASLFNLGYDGKSLKETLGFVRSCEKPSGGFTIIPTGFIPYMEHVYYGMSTLDLLGERAKYPDNTARFVLGCQNANGGFARTDMGISTFEDTFFAVNIMRSLGKL